MSICYDETSVHTGAPIDLTKLDGTAGYLRHYENLLYLTFMHTNGNAREKIQAAKELTICERKLKWWENHPNFDRQAALRGVAALKTQWSSGK